MTAALPGAGSAAQGFHVVTADLRTHANVLSQVADLLGHAHGSGQQAALGDQAFGQIAVSLMFSQLVKSVAGPGVTVLAQAQATMATINRDVTTVASNYDTVEGNNTSRFRPGTSTASPQSNPTSPTAATSKTGHSGGNILNDVTSLEKDISSGNWVQASFAGLNVASDAAKILADPVSAVLRYGLNFLVQHVKPLQDAVGWLVGNPGQVSAFGSAWHGVSQSVGQASGTFASSLAKDTASWSGQAGDNYRRYATDKVATLTAASSATNTIGSVTQSIGTLVGNVQSLIKNMVSQAMGQIIQTALSASFMVTIPVVVAKVVNDVLSWMRKIASVINQLTSSLRQLQPLLGNLTQLFGSIQQALSSGSRPPAAVTSQAVPGITMPTSLARVLPAMVTR